MTLSKSIFLNVEHFHHFWVFHFFKSNGAYAHVLFMTLCMKYGMSRSYKLHFNCTWKDICSHFSCTWSNESHGGWTLCWAFAPIGTGIIALDPTFGSFYLIKTGFTIDEPVSLVKVFRLFRLERIFLVFRVWTQQVDVQHLIYWQGPACLWCLVWEVYLYSFQKQRRFVNGYRLRRPFEPLLLKVIGERT